MKKPETRSKREAFLLVWKDGLKIRIGKKCDLSSSRYFYLCWFIQIILLIFIIFIHFTSTCQVQPALTSTHITFFRYNFLSFITLAFIMSSYCRLFQQSSYPKWLKQYYLWILVKLVFHLVTEDEGKHYDLFLHKFFLAF